MSDIRARADPFLTNGSVAYDDDENKKNLFLKLAYTFPFSSSAVDAYITSIVSKQFIKFKPTYLNIP